MVSLPPAPITTSSPLPPLILSAPAPPLTVSAPALPRIFALSSGASSKSANLVPVTLTYLLIQALSYQPNAQQQSRRTARFDPARPRTRFTFVDGKPSRRRLREDTPRRAQPRSIFELKRSLQRVADVAADPMR